MVRAAAGSESMSRKLCVFVAGLALVGAVQAQDEEEKKPLPVEAETGYFTAWSGNVAFGLYGSSGNTERVNLRGEVDGTRETDKNLSRFLGTYSYAKDDGDESENKGQFLVENDFKLEDSKWFLFGRAQIESDNFQDWDQRFSVFAGPGRVFIDNEKTKLTGKVGVGAVREFGGSDDAWRAEAIISAYGTHQLTERQKLIGEVDIYPNLNYGGEARTRERLVWEIMVDPEVNMSLRAGVEHRYDTTSEAPTKKSDVDYFIMLSWAY